MNRGKYPILNEISGIILILLGIAVTISIISFDPSDKLIWHVHHLPKTYHNLFGIVGAHISGLLLLLLGFASPLIPIFLSIAGILRLMRKPFLFNIADILFSILFIVTLSGILQFILGEKQVLRGLALYPGGLIGKKFLYVILICFNKFGAGIILGFIFFISFMFLGRLSIGKICSYLNSIIRRLTNNRLRNRSIKIKGKEKEMDEPDNRQTDKPDKFDKFDKFDKPDKPDKADIDLIIKEPDPDAKVIELIPEDKEEAEGYNIAEKMTENEYLPPSLDLLDDPPKKENMVSRDELENNARLLKEKLLDFGIEGDIVEILPGPVVTMYEFKPAPGIKISKIAGLSDDLAMALKALNIRIVAPLPGKGVVGIEIPNKNRKMVYLKEILTSDLYVSSKYKLPIALGKDITGMPVVTDLTRMPHLLIAGATGTGKSVCINTMINSIIFDLSPKRVRFLMIDPKRIELSVYNDIPHLLHPVVSQPKEATNALLWAVNEMERRYELLSATESRNIDTYNQKISRQKDGYDFLPYIVIIIDELADLMMTSSKKVEESLARLAQMARAAGIHLVLATQRPSVDVLTGIIKANFPTRISFQVSSRVDSRTILDSMGAENLLGNGDMLFLPPGVAGIQRIHGAFISEEEVKRITDFLKAQRKAEYEESIMESIKVVDKEGADEDPIQLDEKYEEAVELVEKTGQASISMLQRRLRIGYNRAARMIEAMEAEGIVGPSDGIKPRAVYGRKKGNS